MTYLINKLVLMGNWCSTPGCFDEGVEPWTWTGSKAIYEKWLTENSIVKYGQCWVFGGILSSACRSLGVGSRTTTNFNSAHGHPPFNKGIDDFFMYNEKMELVNEHSNKGESIWNFHVWNDAWMKRLDLPGLDADGWQTIDATPQEQSWEVQDGQDVGRYMLGPAPLNAIRSRRMETA